MTPQELTQAREQAKRFLAPDHHDGPLITELPPGVTDNGKGKFEARIRRSGKAIYGGTFATITEASAKAEELRAAHPMARKMKREEETRPSRAKKPLRDASPIRHGARKVAGKY